MQCISTKVDVAFHTQTLTRSETRFTSSISHAKRFQSAHPSTFYLMITSICSAVNPAVVLCAVPYQISKIINFSTLPCKISSHRKKISMYLLSLHFPSCPPHACDYRKSMPYFIAGPPSNQHHCRNTKIYDDDSHQVFQILFFQNIKRNVSIRRTQQNRN